MRLTRRISRDITERGRSVEDVIQQYNTTVRPMHMEHVEPSKHKADFIVHSTGQSMEVVIKTLSNHMKAEADLL